MVEQRKTQTIELVLFNKPNTYLFADLDLQLHPIVQRTVQEVRPSSAQFDAADLAGFANARAVPRGVQIEIYKFEGKHISQNNKRKLYDCSI